MREAASAKETADKQIAALTNDLSAAKVKLFDLSPPPLPTLILPLCHVIRPIT